MHEEARGEKRAPEEERLRSDPRQRSIFSDTGEYSIPLRRIKRVERGPFLPVSILLIWKPMSSVFSRIVAGEIPCYRVWEDESFLAFLDIHPVQAGQVLLIPKQEIDSPFDMEDDLYVRYLLAAKRLVGPLRRAMGSLKVALVIEGLEVPHAHIKLIPISQAGDLEASLIRSPASEELSGIAERIRSELAASGLSSSSG